MSGKDDYIFNKSNLLVTGSGRKIFKSGLIRDKKYTSFKFYLNKSRKEYDGFAQRYKDGIYELIKSDPDPVKTHRDFIKEIGGTTELELTPEEIESLKLKLENPSTLFDRINRILNSNFIKMTFPVFYALFDGYADSKDLRDDKLRNNVIDGHLIAIDLSEPMDRILDKDEDLDYLEDYKFINPYILLLAKQKINETAPGVLEEFRSGFADALLGQQIDYNLKIKKLELTYENLEQSYKKYRSVLGTAGRNMSLNQRPLSEIYYIGMAKAAECVGCGNEIQDAIVTKGIKSPSWPLFYSNLTHDVKTGFRLTLEKSKSYLSEAYLALEMLDNDVKIKPFLEFLFLTVSHYNEFWYRELVTKRADLLHSFQNELDKK
jgi:Asp-tRNA(Asn)/Glu-tRNA(Gln) amidotransferase C subunit